MSADGSPASAATCCSVRSAEVAGAPAPSPPLIAPQPLLSCALNVSEGRDRAVIAALAAAGGDLLLDVHSDPEHHRSVLTLGGPAGDCEAAARAVVARAVALLDLSGHRGVHPRRGSVDVVPFCPLLPGATSAELAAADLSVAIDARDSLAQWAAATLTLPCFCFGPLPGGGRSLPEVRRRAFVDLAPDHGPAAADPRSGAICIGARRSLAAYNLLLTSADRALGRRIAAALRGPDVRCLAFQLAAGVQISCNLVAPWRTGPAEVHAALAALAAPEGAPVAGCELVGLLPAAVLEAVPPDRRAELGLAADASLEARLVAGAVTLLRAGQLPAASR